MSFLWYDARIRESRKAMMAASTPLPPISFPPAGDDPVNYIDIADFLRDQLRQRGGSYWAVDFRTTTDFDGLRALLEGMGWTMRSKVVKSGRRDTGGMRDLSTTALFARETIDGFTGFAQLFINNDNAGDLYVWTADAETDLSTEMAPLINALPIPAPKTVSETMVYFSFLSPNGPKIKHRYIKTPEFNEIVGNYPDGTLPELRRLAALNADNLSDANGHVILLHGPPGTGKTTLLRAFSREWRKWANLLYVVDPDELFRNSAYLYSLLDADQNSKWGYVVFLEDVDEFIGPRAKEATGQAFSRLLNLSDGFLGQGLNLLLVMTTNIKLEDIQPALKRPGRCLADINIPAFPVAQATRWLGRPVKTALTLASLYEMRGESEQMKVLEAERPVGTYL